MAGQVQRKVGAGWGKEPEQRQGRSKVGAGAMVEQGRSKEGAKQK